MKRLIAAALVPITSLALLLPVLSGCGLIFGGSRQTIQANSSPSGATIKTAPMTATLTTPASVSLERKKDYTLTFSKDGYTSADVQVSHHVRGGIIVLDILLGLVPVIVDAPSRPHGSTGQRWHRAGEDHVEHTRRRRRRRTYEKTLISSLRRAPVHATGPFLFSPRATLSVAG